jgi:hypothetical protein
MIQNFPELWMHTICQGSVEGVLGLYRPNAVLVPTYSDRVLSGHRELAKYFKMFLGKEGLCGRIDGLVEQDLGSVKSVSGIYTFGWTERGRPKSVAARFTFVLTPESIHTGRVWVADKRWRIVTHHSSEMPDL